MNSAIQTSVSKVSEVTPLFWVVKIAATTLGETGGDAASMSLGLGYLVATGLFAAIFGGTTGYMSPEQQLTLDSLRRGDRPLQTIDERTDIFSLGVLLSEMLQGTKQQPLAAILHRCLQHDPNERYCDAESLATDLRGCLVGPNSSSRMGLRFTPLRLVLLSSVLIATGYLAAFAQSQTGMSALPSLIQADTSVELADPLHRVVDQLRLLDGSRKLPHDQHQKIDAMCGRIWGKRAALASPETANDLTDLAILWCDLRIGLAVLEQQAESVSRLQEAERLLGLTPALCLEICRHATAAGNSAVAHEYTKRRETLVARTAREHDALGRSLLRAGELDQAETELRRAVELAPDDFWSNFYAGTVAFQLKRFDDAIASFSACIALSPERAECYYDRGMALIGAEYPERAKRDFNRASQLDSTLHSPQIISSKIMN